MAAFLSALPAIGGLFGNIFGGNQSNNALKNVYTNAADTANAGIQRGEGIFNQWSNPLFAAMLDAQGLTQRNVIDQMGPLLSWNEFLSKNAGDQMAGYGAGSYNPALQSALDRMSYFGGNDSPMYGLGTTAGNLFSGGGWTPQYQDIFDNLSALQKGYNSTQQNMSDVGNGLMSMRGQTAQTQGMQDRMMDTANAGGWSDPLKLSQAATEEVIGQRGRTSPLENLSSTGSSLLQSGGLSPQAQAALGVAGQGFANQGQTSQTQGLVNRGLNLAGVDALIPLDKAITMAREDANRTVRGKAEQAMRQALARGGDAGSVVGYGGRNAGIMDFADQASDLEAAAVRDAVKNYQDAAQKQQQIGGSLATSGLGAEGERLGTFGQILSALQNAQTSGRSLGSNLALGSEGLMSDRQLSSLGLVPTFQNAASNLLGTATQGGLGAGNLELGRMNLGNTMANGALNSMLSANQLANSTMGNQNQYALGGGSLANSLYNSTLGANNNWLSGLLGGLNSNNQMAANTGQFANDAAKNWGNMYNSVSGNWNNANQFMGNMAGAGLNYAGNYINMLGNMFNNQASTTANRPNYYGGLGAAAGGILGNLFGGGNNGDPYGDGRGGGG